ncbi:LamG-like jellyroll fold domain-containing protein [Stackebrandtia nassauensis]|uniref:LamG-like jellyroll fold domain-containing protein n=1 Tax=Stackebrandtia nassauensis (strain DSM 44728 / CIP 108903 / NRRL B-16338 / NBRC 102104 / LLR-40K-21) TaxID=446470 RepID=D3Q9V4_STANL|nr:LamG-like jellyroll fold domain-containing protein [Stackebrandtia nassauensis]ADD44650.1 hypothetical protein Snas_5013 [Stackebrandtia nassauensis DSM 44728]
MKRPHLNRRTVLYGAAAATAATALGMGASRFAQADAGHPPNLSAYDRKVLADKPVAYWRLSHPSHGKEYDQVNGHLGTYYNVTKTTRLPNGDGGAIFNGANGYFRVPSHKSFSITTTGRLTIEAWISPHTLEFAKDEQSGYVHFIGKGKKSGSGGDREWAGRIYSKTNAENRPNRISGYAWNPSGGYGAGSYFQDAIRVKQFIHWAIAFDLNEGKYGTVRVYRDGKLRQGTELVYRKGTEDEVIVVPKPGTAPVQVGSRDGKSWFNGVIAKVAIYNRRLSETQLRPHADLMHA